MTKLCVVCKHFDIYEGQRGFDMTPGEDGALQCNKEVWPESDYCGRVGLFGMDLSEFRALIRTAERCPHFEPADA